MSDKKLGKDVLVAVRPEKKFAEVKGNTADGMLFCKRHYNQMEFHLIGSQEVQKLVELLKQEGLTFTFRAQSK